MDSDSRILVAGSNGMVGSAIVRNLKKKGYFNIIKGTRNDVDFTIRMKLKDISAQKNLNMCLLLLQKLVVSWQTTIIKQTF